MDGPESARAIVVIVDNGKNCAIKAKNKEKAIQVIKENILFFLPTLFFIYLLVVPPSFSLISNLLNYIINSLSLANKNQMTNLVPGTKFVINVKFCARHQICHFLIFIKNKNMIYLEKYFK